MGQDQQEDHSILPLRSKCHVHQGDKEQALLCFHDSLEPVLGPHTLKDTPGQVAAQGTAEHNPFLNNWCVMLTATADGQDILILMPV